MGIALVALDGDKGDATTATGALGPRAHSHVFPLPGGAETTVTL
jgi:hypothetical protein